MNKEFKKNFFMCLLVVLLVISNLFNLKYTNFLDITIGVDFVTFPFTFLCTLLIMNLGGKKEAYRSILIASIIQLLITISYTLAISLGSQSIMPDQAIYVNHVFQVNELNIIASVLAFGMSHSLLIYIYENFAYFKKELYGIVIGLLGAFFLNSAIFLLITLHNYQPIYIANMFLSNIIIDVIMIVIITILFYILKEPHERIIIYKKTSDNKNLDLSTEEVLETKKEVKKKKTNTHKGTSNNYRKNSSNNSKNKSSSTKTRNTKVKKNEQVKKSKESK